jgi:hypothetical protein
MPLFKDTIPLSNRVIRDSKNRIPLSKTENDVERRFQHEKSYHKANFVTYQISLSLLKSFDFNNKR